MSTPTEATRRAAPPGRDGHRQPHVVGRRGGRRTTSSTATFLGDTDFVWGPERLREEDARLLGDPRRPGRARDRRRLGPVLALARRPRRDRRGHRPVRRHGRDRGRGQRQPSTRAAAACRSSQCDGRALPFADASFDTVFTAYGVVPFVADSDVVMAEAARVLRPGGRFVFSTTHPVRWAFPDDPGPGGLTARHSYFDRTPYVEQDARGPGDLRRAPPHARRPGARDHGRRARARRPRRAGVARRPRRAVGWLVAAARAGSSPARPSSSAASPPDRPWPAGDPSAG